MLERRKNFIGADGVLHVRGVVGNYRANGQKLTLSPQGCTSRRRLILFLVRQEPQHCLGKLGVLLGMNPMSSSRDGFELGLREKPLDRRAVRFRDVI